VLIIAIVPDLNDSWGQVGYLLGLGDRHPSNLMLDRQRLVYTCTSFNLFFKKLYNKIEVTVLRGWML